jgi:hypothetical protein
LETLGRESVTRGARLRVEQNVGTWLSMPVTRYRGRLTQLVSVVPQFERRPFETPRMPGRATRANEHYDAIVRIPVTAAEAEVPVGIVSRSYRLVQHREVIEHILEVMREADIDTEGINASVSLTTYGERMALSILLPDQDRFSYQLGPDDSMRLRLECFNSVDRSTKFMAVVGWLRFVCRNGLVLGKTLAYLRGAHTQQLDVESFRTAVHEGIRDADLDRARCEAWRAASVGREAVTAWVDEPLRKAWGVKAAARVYAICRTGFDLVLTSPFEKAPPSRRAGEQGRRVPGAPERSETAFDVAQALSWLAGQRKDLSWLAGQRKDLSERLEATRDIPELIELLLKPRGGTVDRRPATSQVQAEIEQLHD